MKFRIALVGALISGGMFLAGCNSTESDWKHAKEANVTSAYARFLDRHPQGAHADEAKAAIENLDWKAALLTNNVSGFLTYLRTHSESPRLTLSEGTVASTINYHIEVIGYGLEGTYRAELVVTVDGSRVSMSDQDACKFGIVDCEASLDGPKVVYTKPARKANIVRDRPGGRILALQFVGHAPDKPEKAIHDAAVTDDAEAAGELLGKQPNLVSRKDASGHTPLLEAASWGSKAVVALLLASQANVEAPDSDGHTPLYCAAALGHEDVVEELLLHGAAVDAKCQYCTDPLSLAAERGHKGVVEVLLAHGAAVNAKDQFGSTPLRAAAGNGYKDIVNLLLAHGGDVKVVSGDGDTLLHIAAALGHKDVVEVLLARGVDVNAKTPDGSTALHYAASQEFGDAKYGWRVDREGYQGVVELLLNNQANPNAMDKSGATPLRLAERNGHRDVAELLRQHGGR